MKNSVKGFFAGIMISILCLVGIVSYANTKTDSIEVVLNGVNISINGQNIGTIGEEYVLADGAKRPLSILYNGTTYLPLKKTAEILGKEVSWDGKTSTVGINDASTIQTTETAISNNSRMDPAGLGQSLVADCNNILYGNYKVEITLMEIIRGEKAKNMAYNANKFNDLPKDGKELILAKYKIKMVSTENDAAIDINHAMFEAVNESGFVYDDFVVISGIEPDLSTDYYQGSEKEGYTYFLVDEGDRSNIRFRCKYDTYVWFKTY